MRIFSKLYQLALRWAAHPHAPSYLAGLSFAESSFFPVPPDVMLAPMTLAKPERAWYFATLTTFASVLGGAAGYALGWFAFEAITPWLQQWGYWQDYLGVKDWFDHWGVWVVFLAGFTFIPYKIFTITAGALGMAFVPFLLASFIGRGARFFLVAGVIVIGGPRMEQALHRYIDIIGWVVVILLVLFVLIKWF